MSPVIARLIVRIAACCAPAGLDEKRCVWCGVRESQAHMTWCREAELPWPTIGDRA